MARARGFVYLVGAGPGGPGLLTLRGAECLAVADVVVSDALVNPRLLEHCRPDAKLIDAGKRGHGRVAMKQAAINRLLVRLARSGKQVVRLKGGDPYFFGRGGEEALHLRAARVPFEVVPGVSSVSAAPAFAGVPLTHRRLTSMVTVVTGHTGAENTYSAGRDAARLPGVDWSGISPRGTLVVLMGISHLPDIVRRLREAGWKASTRAAVVRWGSMPSQASVDGTLGDIVARVRLAGIASPAVVVFGDVVALRSELNWFERLPLFGRTVVVTRAAHQAGELADLLERRGARVLFAASIEMRPLPGGARFLEKLPDYNGVLFASANAARMFAERWTKAGRAWPEWTEVLAVGTKTAAALASAGLPVHRVAKEFVAESLAAAAGARPGMKFLIPRAEEGREVLPETLRRHGAAVDVWPLYRTVPRPMAAAVREALRDGRVDCVTFTSSSTVKSFLKAVGASRRKIFRTAAAASIGPVTSKSLRDAGILPKVRAKRPTVEDLAAAVEAHFRGRKR